MIGSTLKAWHCIQVKQGGKWLFLSDAAGIVKFETSVERDARIAELKLENT